ncbi:Dbl homology domain-containing protein [Baffinella frigidus]|nr:Dbl homology domain-containing protein [Cryptophyta sp. CCMP2293]
MASSGVPPAVQELLATETTFSEALHRMLEVYHKPLRDAQYKLTPLLHEREIDEIFGNVEDLLIIADELQRTLLKRISEATSAPSGKAPKVGDILTNFAGIFRLYERYIINYERGANRLGECKEKEKGFAAFLEKQGAIPGVLPLESYLIMPVQCKEKEKGFAAFLERQGAIPGVLPLESCLIMPVQIAGGGDPLQEWSFGIVHCTIPKT